MTSPQDIQNAIQAAIDQSQAGEGFTNSVVGGTTLVRPAISSPNYVPGVSGWSINADGSAQFYDVALLGGSIILFNANDVILMYSGPPAAGNLQLSISNTDNVDEYGNVYPAGEMVGAEGDNQVYLIPNVSTAFNITTAIAGIMAGAVQLDTADVAQAVAGFLGAALLNTGAAAKMTTILTSPFGTQGAAISLESQNDGGTDTPIINLGFTSTPDNETIVFTPIVAIMPTGYLVYGGTQSVVVQSSTTPGSRNFTIPAGVTTVKAESYGAATGGHTGTVFGINGNGGSYGGAAGEYACEPSLAVTAPNVPYTVGAGSPGTLPGGGTPNNAGNSTITGNAVTVTAHGGTITGNLPIGGNGSTNAIHHNGGNGGTNPHYGIPPAGNYNGGAGGGGSAGPTKNGNAGSNTNSNNGAKGATAVSGGSAGGNGGGQPGTAGQNGQNASGGGGGWANTVSSTKGGDGGNGQCKITYTPTGTPTILMSVANAAGTDQFGNAFNAGFRVSWDGVLSPFGQSDPFTSAAVPIPASGFTPVITRAVQPGSYSFEGVMRLKQGATGSIPGNIGFTGPTNSFAVWYSYTTYQGIAQLGNTPAQSFASQGNVLGGQTVAGNECTAYFKGIVTFTAAGNFVVGCQADGTHPFTAQPGCMFRIRPGAGT